MDKKLKNITVIEKVKHVMCIYIENTIAKSISPFIAHK